MKRLFAVAGILLITVFQVLAQQAGSIVGSVYDQQNASVPNASVVVRDNATGATSNAKTTAEGLSRCLPCPPAPTTSRWLLPAPKSGKPRASGVITAQESSVRATLQIGAATETVSVETVAEVGNATSSELTTNVDRKQIIDLPTSTRNPCDFATQMAGVTSTGSATSGTSIMNGLRGSSNNLTQDGIDIRDSFIKTSGFGTNYGYTPSLESAGEFSITGQNLEADSGAGGVTQSVNLLTASTRGLGINPFTQYKRLRYRDGYEKPLVWMEPNKVYKVTLQPMTTSNYFAPGHSLRIEVSSSNFPRVDRNLNTGGNNYDEAVGRIAHTAIHHSTQYSSKIVISVAR